MFYKAKMGVTCDNLMSAAQILQSSLVRFVEFTKSGGGCIITEQLGGQVRILRIDSQHFIL
jgi:hypothetical protein